MHLSDVSDTVQGHVALTRIGTIRSDICCINGLPLTFMHRDRIGQFNWELPVSANIDAKQGIFERVIMICEQLEVFGVNIELRRPSINPDISDLSLGIGLNVCYSTNFTVIIQPCINR